MSFFYLPKLSQGKKATSQQQASSEVLSGWCAWSYANLSERTQPTVVVAKAVAVSFKKPNTEVLSKQELSRIATDGTVFLSCWMTVAQIEDMKNRKVLFTDLE